MHDVSGVDSIPVVHLAKNKYESFYKDTAKALNKK